MQKSCTAQWELQHLNVLCVSTATYVTFRVNWASVSTYTFSCRLILVPALEGLHTRCIPRAATLSRMVCLFFSFVCAYPVCLCIPPIMWFLVSVPQLSLFCAWVPFVEVRIPQISSGLHTHFCVSCCLSIFEYMCCRMHISICENFSSSYM